MQKTYFLQTLAMIWLILNNSALSAQCYNQKYGGNLPTNHDENGQI